MRSANLTGKIHPRTGEPLVPLYVRDDGTAVWPALGAAPDDSDPDDPHFTGQDDDEDDEDSDDEDEEDEDEDEPKSKKKKPVKKKTDDDDEEDDEDEDARVHRASQQAKRYRLALRAEQKKTADLAARIKAIEDETRAPDEVAARDIAELREKNTTQADVIRTMTAQLAFFKSNTVAWIDPSDAFALAERAGLFDDLVDEDGTVDERELRRGLRELAKRKPHLVKKDDDSPKARGRKSNDNTDEDEEDDDEEPRSRRSAGTMNSKRKGTKGTADRAALAKKFPVLQRF
jgi:hypothetical protein